MQVQYMVKSFVPKVSGCGAQDNGWDQQRCSQFETFLNDQAREGWKLHSSEFRAVTIKGCSGGKGSWLVCIFEKPA